MKPSTTPQVHVFYSSSEAYSRSQCDDSIRCGDVLHVPSENAIAIMIEAWPSALDEQHKGEEFHVIAADVDTSAIPSVLDDSPLDFSASVAVARKLAEPTPPRVEYEVVGPAHMGYALREIASGEFVVDAIDSVLDAREHAFRANGGVALNLYVEMPETGFNEEHADLASGIAAFDSLISHYPDAYARLHWLDDHGLIVREHTPARYAS